MRAEFHIHTTASSDSLLTKCLLFLMCRIKKIECIAITDHNEIKNALAYRSFFEKKGISVIVGEEIFTTDGEVIGLYLNSKIEPNMSLSETIKEIKQQKGLVYVPHPYDGKRHKNVLAKELIAQHAKDIDLIECHNGRNIKEKYSNVQNGIAEEIGITKIVGSDAHTFYEIGRNYCEIDSCSKEHLVKEIKKEKFLKSKCIKLAHHNTKIVRLIKIIAGGKWNELSRIINKKLKRNK